LDISREDLSAQSRCGRGHRPELARQSFGKVFTREELEWIANFTKRHDLFVFTDEIYEYLSSKASISAWPRFPECANGR